MKKSVITSVVILVLLGASVLLGFTIDSICDMIDKKTHPLKYTEFVEHYSEVYNVPKEIVYAVIKTESDFVSNAVSHAGAVGLMQMMPDTFLWLCEKQGEDLSKGMLYDPETSIKYGTYYLSYLYDQFGMWETVYAAYNCGPGRVKDWQTDTEYAESNGVLFYIPIKETSQYVKKVEKAVSVYKKIYFKEIKQ